MSDLRFARELGAEFERLEGAASARSPDRRSPLWSDRLAGRMATVVAVAVPLAVAVLAIALLSHSRHGARPSVDNAAAGKGGLALTGGNCRTPARTAPLPHGVPRVPAADGMIRAAGGRVAGIPWQLRVKPYTFAPGGTEHGRLRLGARQYGLCGRRPAPLQFGLINAGPHGIVYGYVAEAIGSYSITVSAGSTQVSSFTDTFFFIGALPRPACSYRTLTITATSTRVSGLPPNISRSLDDNPTRLSTTTRFGNCRPHALVSAIAQSGQAQGRSPKAPLATAVAQASLIAPPGSDSHARGQVWELTHSGERGINLLAVGLSPGRYGVWVRGPHGRTSALAAVTVKHELVGSYDLPADARSALQILVTTQASGHIDTPGRTVLHASLR